MNAWVEMLLFMLLFIGFLIAGVWFVAFFSNPIVFSITLAVFGYFAVKLWWEERR
jgi:hypothetical protein